VGIEGAESALSSLENTLIIKMLLFRQGFQTRKTKVILKRAAAATWPPARLTAIAGSLAGGCSDPLRLAGREGAAARRHFLGTRH